MLKEKVLLNDKLTFNFEGFINYTVELCQINNQEYSLIDGIKIYYTCGSWAHIRTSNTEPIIRLIIESTTKKKSVDIKNSLIKDIHNFLK